MKDNLKDSLTQIFLGSAAEIAALQHLSLEEIDLPVAVSPNDAFRQSL